MRWLALDLAYEESIEDAVKEVEKLTRRVLDVRINKVSTRIRHPSSPDSCAGSAYAPSSTPYLPIGRVQDDLRL